MLQPNNNLDTDNEVSSNIKLSNNEADDESSKSYLFKKLFEDSKEVSSEKEFITEATTSRPVPKPRKNYLTRKLENTPDSNSSRKTYNVEENIRANNFEAVDILVHNPLSLNRRGSTGSNETYVKNITSKIEISENANLTGPEKDSSDAYISTESDRNEKIKKKVISDYSDIETDSKHKYEKILEIIIHKTDALQVDSYVTHPMVKVHIVDINTGKYYLKSNKSRSVVFYYESEEQDYILPVMTGSYNLQQKRTFSPKWEESILFNEDFSYLTNENIIIFFEVLDYVPSTSRKFEKMQKHCYKGWHRITFAFLKLLNDDSPSNSTNKKVKLQLYYPREIKKRNFNTCDLWYIWKASKLKKYPAALYVTIKEVISPNKIIETFRSKTPLQKEGIPNARNHHKQTSQDINVTAKNEILSNDAVKSSKQIFELPNKPLAELDSYDNGCLILKFSNNGLYLACAIQIKDVFTVIVYTLNSIEEAYSLNEHGGLIYSICWSLDDSLLITASADNTVEIWNCLTHSFIQILPHPVYVYASHINSDNTIIATGGYDTTVRIWLYDKREEKYELHQEMEDHEGYVTSIYFNNKSTNLYSCDSTGQIFEWSIVDNSDWQYNRDISTPDLKHTVINEIRLFPNEKKMLVHSRDSVLRIISIKRACVLHWLQGALNSRIQTFCSITSCGNYVTSGSENGLVVVWDAKTGKDIITYEPFLNRLYLESVNCVQFHPKDNVIAFSHYGSISPILLYHYNKAEEEKVTNKFQYVLSDNIKKSSSNERSDQKQNYFHEVLEKMDKLLT